MTLQDIIGAIKSRGAFIDPSAYPEDRTEEAIACLRCAIEEQEALEEVVKAWDTTGIKGMHITCIRGIIQKREELEHA